MHLPWHYHILIQFTITEVLDITHNLFVLFVYALFFLLFVVSQPPQLNTLQYTINYEI